MKGLIMGLCLFLLHINTYSEPATDYLDKFLTYTQWCEHLPNTPDPKFLAFIDTPTPLTQKLREKWLYQLAYNKDWTNFNRYYQESSDTNLQCYALTAMYHQEKKPEVLQKIDSLWLNGGSQPRACDALFTDLLKNHQINDHLIRQRVSLALNNQNVSLARYLLKQFKPARIQDADLLTSIYQNPKRIEQLAPGQLHGAFYLFGLKLMVSKHIDEAIRLYDTPLAKTILNQEQKQQFLAYIALYKAMRNQPDARHWFAKVKPQGYFDELIEWEIRYALIHQHWKNVIKLIDQSKNKMDPCWIYWKARALQALDKKDQADELYRQIAGKRNYYGFLASIRLNKKPKFENEASIGNVRLLTPYKPIMEQIKNFYLSGQTLQASRLLNDFSSELSKDEKSALAYWLAYDLHWYGKSIYLSNNDLLNNQLTLRFPLAHQHHVRDSAKLYQITPALIFAVIRQESAFQDHIVSTAGANGLMQVLPNTAAVIAKHEKIAYTNKTQLFSPEKNIHIGTAYLKQLAHQFHQHPILMMAAYNAGPKQVNFWLKNHEPRDIDIWIETLPWRETRNYLKNIVAFYSVYQYRMHEKLCLDNFMAPF